MVITRLAVVAVILLVLVVGVMFLLRSLLLTGASPREDSSHPLIGVLQAQAGPQLIDAVLTEPRGLAGEEEVGGLAIVTVVVSPSDDLTTYHVVNATSPTDGSQVVIGDDELVADDGSTWTLSGEPVDPAQPPLQRFPTIVRESFVVVDFTQPDPP